MRQLVTTDRTEDGVSGGGAAIAAVAEGALMRLGIALPTEDVADQPAADGRRVLRAESSPRGRAASRRLASTARGSSTRSAADSSCPTRSSRSPWRPR